MKTLLSERRRKFYAAVRVANEQTTEWLTACIVNPGKFQSPLATLACIRILACRETSGRPYQERKKAVKGRIEKLKTALNNS